MARHWLMIAVPALNEPDLRQIFEAPVSGDVGRRNMAMVIENGKRLSELEVGLFARGGREQKILREKGFVHGVMPSQGCTFDWIRPGRVWSSGQALLSKCIKV
jgi:hypothetical protein